MTLSVIILIISIITALTVLYFRAWELRTGRTTDTEKIVPVQHLTLRHLERIMLYLTKNVVQYIVLAIVKFWFIIVTKFKIWVKDKFPKLNSRFNKTTDSPAPQKPSFIKKAVLESKSKIKRLKQKIREEHAVESE
jgi:hypothetical protein